MTHTKESPEYPGWFTVEKLEKWFFRRYADKLKKVAMVVDRSKDNEWEEVSTTYVKFLD